LIPLRLARRSQVGYFQQSYELLIVDDDASFRETLRLVFEPHFLLIEAECGEQAIEILQQHPVHLALFDMHMAVLTGLETLKIVKSMLVQLPCILITADATDDLRRDAQAARAYTVLRKPVSKRELVSSVAGALQDTYDDLEITQRLIAS
jgi:CheY-like chemotaxis protein